MSTTSMNGNKVCKHTGRTRWILRMMKNIPCCPKDGKGYFVRRQVILGLTPTYAVACAPISNVGIFFSRKEENIFEKF